MDRPAGESRRGIPLARDEAMKLKLAITLLLVALAVLPALYVVRRRLRRRD